MSIPLSGPAARCAPIQGPDADDWEIAAHLKQGSNTPDVNGVKIIFTALE